MDAGRTQEGAFGSSSAASARGRTRMRAMITPVSYSSYIGTAMIDCETASGGVMNAATMNTPSST